MRLSDQLYELQEYHSITVTEAGYNNLYCHLRPSRPTLWTDVLNNVTEWPVESWLVENMECELVDSATYQYNGRLMPFYTPKKDGNGMLYLPSTGLQHFGRRPHLERPCYVDRGVGVLFRKPVCIATDVAKIVVQYRLVRND